MKAVVKDRPEPGVWVKEMPKPSASSNEVLIKVKRASICGSDIGIYDYSAAYSEFAKLPLILGHEFVGEVAEIGSDALGFKIGDRVVAESVLSCGTCSYCRSGQTNLCLSFKVLGIHTNGGFSEYANVPWRHVHHLRNELSFREGSLIEPAAVACHAVLDGRLVEPMDFVTVIGPGPIGLIAGQIARAAGCSRVFVVGIDVDEKRLAIAQDLGFGTINSSQEDPVRRIRELTDGIGADVAIVAVGAAQALSQACELVRKGGKIHCVGIFSKPVELAVTSLVRKEVSLLGTFVSTWKNYEQAMTLAVSEKVNLKPLVTHEFQIDQAVSAFEKAKSREGCKVQFLI